VVSLFRFSNFLVLPLWALMILLPRWRWTTRIMRSPFVSALPATLYAALVLPRLGEVWPIVLRPALSSVAVLLGSPAGATIAWVHFLAFDLFVGRWIYLEGHERQVNPWLMAPVLFLTLMLGPAGFLLYLMVRSVTVTPAKTKEPLQSAA
jgi:ABA DEFICIENT 4-like